MCAPRESPYNMTNCLVRLVWWVNKTSIGLLMFALDANRQQRQHWPQQQQQQEPPAEPPPPPPPPSIGNACDKVAPQADGRFGPCSLGQSRLRLMWNYCFNALPNVKLLFFWFSGNICIQIAGFFALSNCHSSEGYCRGRALTEI